MPCPFCSAPDFLVYGILQTEEAMAKGATCKQCGRGARAVFTRNKPDEVQFEIVQTSGEDPPSYLPKMRRSA